MTFSYPLPNDTCQKFTGSKNNRKCANLSLLLDRYVGYKDGWNFDEEQKAALFKAVAKHFQHHQELPELIKANYLRWHHVVRSFPYSQHFSAAPEWRMVIGLGQASILETSMTLDRITGIPIIPGSALKGLAASYAMLCDLSLSIAEDSDIRSEAEKNETFKAIFGTQDKAGRVIFFDAVPIEAPNLEPDIMNNHYPEYYSDKNGNVAPTPYQNPVPVYFLTLGKKSKFAFAVASRNNCIDTRELVEQARSWLQAGLSELGVGAKTAAGYGYLIADE